jgi:hypothetical protein
LMHHGDRMGVNFALRQWSKSSVNSTLFFKYINNIFAT